MAKRGLIESRSDPSVEDSTEHLRTLRARLLTGLALFVIAALFLVAPPIVGGELTVGLVLKLAVAAVTLPLLASMLAGKVFESAEDLHEAHDDLRRKYDQARVDALLDPITGLGNHRAFQEEVARQIETVRREGRSLALAIVDLDDLKRVNDERGHAGGDEVLGAMGHLVTASSRASDRGFRIGGDEFAILMPNTDADTATAVIKRMLAGALSGGPLTQGVRPFSFSAGLSAYPVPSSDRLKLVRQADAALYWAKRHGRTDVQVFDPERHGASDDRRSTPELAAAVADVANRRLVTPRYQTVFDLRTGQPVGFEGLVRPAEDAGFPNAQSLFLAAEAVERTVELDLACLDVVAAGSRLPKGDQYLALNLSPRTLETEQFHVSDLLKVLKPHRIRPERVVLELTEREAIEDIDRLRANIELCRAAGMRIAADDVGAGNAGLRLLSQVRFDIVKIDLLLVQGGVLHESALAVLRAIRDIAAQSGATVVAEGVETIDQLEVVRRLGLAAGQGYLLAAPTPAMATKPIDLDALTKMHLDRLADLGAPDMAAA